MGPQTRETLRIMLDGARDRVGDAWAAVLGAGTLVVGATAVFLELQDALNRIWRAHHARGNGVLAFVKARVISFALVLAIVFLLLVSLLVSAGLSALSHYAWTQMGGAAALLKAADMLLSFAVITVLFAALFKYLPDTPVPWRDVWEGALFTAGLFTVGKHAIGLYLGTSGVSSSYGAAGSLVLVMMWVYYSTQILLFGAEFTHVVAATRRMSGEKKEKRNGKV
jgi:membrane protein